MSSVIGVRVPRGNMGESVKDQTKRGRGVEFNKNQEEELQKEEDQEEE